MRRTQADWAASGLRARRRERCHGLVRRECNEALLTIYFGLPMCDVYIRQSIAQDLEDDPALFRPDIDYEEYPTRLPDRVFAEMDTLSVPMANDDTLVDQNAAKPLVAVEA